MQRKDLIVEDETSGRRQSLHLSDAEQRFVLSGREADALTLPGLAPGIAVVLTAQPGAIAIEPANVETVSYRLCVLQGVVVHCSRRAVH